MKKYSVSKFYIGMFCLGFLFLIVWEAILIWAEESVLVHAICAVGILSCLYKIFFDLPTAKFSFSDEGITMYVGFKKYETRWAEFEYAGIHQRRGRQKHIYLGYLLGLFLQVFSDR